MPGDQDLGGPAGSVAVHRVPPVAVPVRVDVALIAENGVVDAAAGAQGEDIADSAVAVEVDHQVDAIHLFGEIALHALLGAWH